LILASASPRRADLLRGAGFEFSTRIVDIDEQVRPSETPPTYVRRLAAEKSFAASRRAADGGREQEIILAADTTVVVDGEILGKPRDAADAERMLRLLRGRAHDVITGVSLRHGALELGRVETTRVEFGPLTDAEIRWHVESGDWRDKAGGYAIQGLASRFIRAIHGSYSNVVGLPVATVHELMGEIASDG
jgi:septum formation protein